MGRLTDLVIDVISRPPTERRLSDIRTVLPWLVKTAEAFAGAPKASLYDIIRFCEYRRVVRDHVIIQQGDKGNEFFVMLRGRASVYIDANKTGENAPLSQPEQVDALGVTREEKEQQRDIAAKMKTFLDELEKDDPRPRKAVDRSEEYQLDRSQFGKFIIQYDDGKTFGEIALMSDDSIRNATIIADDETDLLVISRDLFNKSLKEQQQKEYEERARFISDSPLFNWWTPRFKRLLEMSVRKEVYPYGSNIVTQGQPFQGLHFILSGRAVVVCTPNDHARQFPAVMSVYKSTVPEEEKPTMEKELRQERVRVRRNDGYTAAETQQRLRQIEVAHVCTGDVIGDVENALSLDAYCASVTANSEVHCLLLDGKNMERLLPRKHQLSVDALHATAAVKLAHRARQRLPDGTQLPLFAALHANMQNRLQAQAAAGAPSDPATREMRTQMRLFLQGKAALVQPCVKDAITVRAQSARREQYWTRRLQEREVTSAKTAAERVRRYQASRRPTFSMRQLQRMTVGPDGGLVDISKPAPARRPGLAPAETLRCVPSSSYVKKKEEEEEEEDDDDDSDDSEVGTRQRVQHLLATTAKDAQGDLQSSTNVWMMLRVVKRLQEVRRAREEQSAGRRGGRAASAPPQAALVTEMGRRASRPTSAATTFDWETSEEVLTELEDRMGDFLQGVKPEAKADVCRLHRFNVNPDRIPLPGGTVMIWPSPCPAEARTADHEHVRHHILPRNALAVMQSLRATNMRPDKEVHRSAAVRQASARQPAPVPDVSVSELTRTLKKTRDRTREDFREIVRQARRPEN